MPGAVALLTPSPPPSPTPPTFPAVPGTPGAPPPTPFNAGPLSPVVRSPPQPPSTAVTLGITLAVDAASVSTPAGLAHLGNGIAQQYATSQNLSLSQVLVSNLQVSSMRRQLLSSVSVSADVHLYFPPSVNVAARLTTLTANPLAGFNSHFLRSFGVTGATAVSVPNQSPLQPSAPSPPPPTIARDIKAALQPYIVAIVILSFFFVATAIAGPLLYVYVFKKKLAAKKALPYVV